MVILPEYNFPYIIDNVSGPVVPKFSWFYDASVNDFLLRPINLLEETTGPTVRVRINHFDFDVPVSWNLLIVDDETKMVDTVPITQCASSNYQALLMHPDMHDYHMSPVTLLDLKPRETCTYVMIPRMHMALHPVGQVVRQRTNPEPRRGDDLSYCCLLSPQDLGKHMGNISVMEIIL